MPRASDRRKNMATKTKATEETVQETVATERNTATEYMVIGDRFKEKKAADKALGELFAKGFKGARLIVQGTEFVILFGTYGNAQTARLNLEAVKKAGINASITE
jgi:hypothetical protein